MLNKNEMTAVNASTAIEAQQSLESINSISENGKEINTSEEDFEAYQREMFKMLDPSYLKTVTMPELYETVFERQSCLIENILHRGTYLFVGSPKVGKSFMMAQIAYHISLGIPLWNHKVNKVL